MVSYTHNATNNRGELTMLEISRDFDGGNIEVVGIDGDVVRLKVELRGTTEDWFYWAFKVSGANGRTLTFEFENSFRVGYYGAAVSYDYKSWNWQNTSGGLQGGSFSYTFGENEDCVYFAHDMLYRPERFYEFADKNKLKLDVLCHSAKGREVPCFTIGEGETHVVIASRHHACESTGSYVIEGFVEEFLESNIPGITVFCVPMVDFDGVWDGDQGKCRAPHDHNRDYAEESIYPEAKAIKEYIDTHNVVYGFDFHAPWHISGENDKVFIVEKKLEKVEESRRFGRLLEASTQGESMKYKVKDNHPPLVGWNTCDSHTFVAYVMSKSDSNFAFTLETTYFGEKDNIFAPERAVELGRCFKRTLEKYLSGEDIKQ